VTTFATKFAKARQAAGLTPTEAAELLGVTRMTIHNWDSGKREPPVKPVLSQTQILKLLAKHR
jgi:DNA-binding XRE family transcriptional regulator